MGDGRARQERRSRRSPIARARAPDRAIRRRPDRHRHRGERPRAVARDTGARTAGRASGTSRTSATTTWFDVASYVGTIARSRRRTSRRPIRRASSCRLQRGDSTRRAATSTPTSSPRRGRRLPRVARRRRTPGRGPSVRRVIVVSDVAERRRRGHRRLPRRPGPRSSACDSLLANGVATVVVVENGEVGSVPALCWASDVVLVSPGVNLGYGRGVNRGVARRPRDALSAGLQPRRRRARRGGRGAGGVLSTITRRRARRTARSCGPTARVYPSSARLPELLARRLSRVARATVAQATPPRVATARRAPTVGRLGVGGVLLGATRPPLKRSADSTSATSCSPRRWRCAWQMREHGYEVARRTRRRRHAHRRRLARASRRARC